MSSFLGLTPSVQVVLQNSLLHTSYPIEGMVTGVIDTGYEGFVAIPRFIFQSLKLNEIQGDSRKVELADKRVSKSTGSFATLQIPHLSMKIQGFTETFPGLDEILIGVEALSDMRVLLDYCTKRVKIESCRKLAHSSNNI